MDDTQIQTAWVLMQELWASYQLPATAEERGSRLTVWAEVLGDFSRAEIREALIEISAQGDKFPPNLGEIKLVAEKIARPPEAPGHARTCTCGRCHYGPKWDDVSRYGGFLDNGVHHPPPKLVSGGYDVCPDCNLNKRHACRCKRSVPVDGVGQKVDA